MKFSELKAMRGPITTGYTLSVPDVPEDFLEHRCAQCGENLIDVDWPFIWQEYQCYTCATKASFTEFDEAMEKIRELATSEVRAATVEGPVSSIDPSATVFDIKSLLRLVEELGLFANIAPIPGKTFFVCMRQAALNFPTYLPGDTNIELHGQTICVVYDSFVPDPDLAVIYVCDNLKMPYLYR